MSPACRARHSTAACSSAVKAPLGLQAAVPDRWRAAAWKAGSCRRSSSTAAGATTDSRSGTQRSERADASPRPPRRDCCSTKASRHSAEASRSTRTEPPPSAARPTTPIPSGTVGRPASPKEVGRLLGDSTTIESWGRDPSLTFAAPSSRAPAATHRDPCVAPASATQSSTSERSNTCGPAARLSPRLTSRSAASSPARPRAGGPCPGRWSSSRPTAASTDSWARAAAPPPLPRAGPSPLPPPPRSDGTLPEGQLVRLGGAPCRGHRCNRARRPDEFPVDRPCHRHHRPRVPRLAAPPPPLRLIVDPELLRSASSLAGGATCGRGAGRKANRPGQPPPLGAPEVVSVPEASRSGASSSAAGGSPAESSSRASTREEKRGSRRGLVDTSGGAVTGRARASPRRPWEGAPASCRHASSPFPSWTGNVKSPRMETSSKWHRDRDGVWKTEWRGEGAGATSARASAAAKPGFARLRSIT
eukprot:scaffold32213_cov101-Isochrysis_galbana.AAC.2